MSRRQGKILDGATEGVEVRVEPDRVAVDFWYPRVDPRPTVVEVGLLDVRAADSIQITYDFKRDGWSIRQASRFEWPAEDTVCDPDWQEVAFVQAWAREEVRVGEPPK